MSNSVLDEVVKCDLSIKDYFALRSILSALACSCLNFKIPPSGNEELDKHKQSVVEEELERYMHLDEVLESFYKGGQGYAQTSKK